MRLDDYLEREELNEGQKQKQFLRFLDDLKDKSSTAIVNMFKKEWNKLLAILQNQDLENDALKIINKRMGTHYKKLDDISRAKLVKGMVKEDVLNEDVTHWWREIRGTTYGIVSFYPAFQCFIQLNKLMDGVKPNMKKILIYGLMYIFIVSGRYIMTWNDWRKSPEGKEEKLKKEKKKEDKKKKKEDKKKNK